MSIMATGTTGSMTYHGPNTVIVLNHPQNEAAIWSIVRIVRAKEDDAMRKLTICLSATLVRRDVVDKTALDGILPTSLVTP